MWKSSLNQFGWNFKSILHEQVLLPFCVGWTKSFIFNMNTKDQLNFFSIKWFLLKNTLAESYFIFHRNITSFLFKKKYHRTYYLNKCQMNIYSAANFMWKWARPTRGLLSSRCTTVIIAMYAIFKINPIVSECTLVSYNVYPTYLFYTNQTSNNPHSSNHQSWELNFSVLNKWKLLLSKSFESLTFTSYKKKYFSWQC